MDFQRKWTALSAFALWGLVTGNVVQAAGTAPIATRLLAQEGLAIALASNVLQTGTWVLSSTLSGPDAVACQALIGGGAYAKSASTVTGQKEAFTVSLYYDTQCAAKEADAVMTVDASKLRTSRSTRMSAR